LFFADIILDLPWLDDEQATLKFVAHRLFTLMHDNVTETNVMEANN
jgi:hypothetical protein